MKKIKEPTDDEIMSYLDERVSSLEDALIKIRQWAGDMDRLSASNMRHSLKGVKDIVESALE